MAAKPVTTKRKPNPKGRMDLLAIRVLEEMVNRKNNPVIAAIFTHTRPALERELASRIGPRTKRGRVVRELVERIAANPQVMSVGRGAQ